MDLPKCSGPLVVKYIKGRNVFANDGEGDANVDSDCDNDSIGAGDEMSKEEEKAEETRAVLTVGSFSACVNFLASHSR